MCRAATPAQHGSRLRTVPGAMLAGLLVFRSKKLDLSLPLYYAVGGPTMPEQQRRADGPMVCVTRRDDEAEGHVSRIQIAGRTYFAIQSKLEVACLFKAVPGDNGYA